MTNYSKPLLVILIILLILGIVNLLLYYFPEQFLPLPNYQPYKSVWTPDDKEDMKKLLTKSLEITRAHDIEMITMFGTLLGVSRHGGVIPWDDDLDFAINLKDRKKFLSLQEKFKNAGIGICPVAAYRVGPFKLPGQASKNRLSKLYWLDRPIISKYTSWSWPFINIIYYEETDTEFLLPNNVSILKKDVFPTKTDLFEGIQISLPWNTKSLLDRKYGDDWKNQCKSSSYNHREERAQSSGDTALCDDIMRSVVNQGILDHVWVINLDRRAERWESTKRRLNKIGIYPTRWSAADKGNHLLINEYNKLSPKITRAEYACYKSHLLLWKHLYESNVPAAIIFEDDIYIPPSVTMEHIKQTLIDSKGFDILLLGHCSAPFLHIKPTGTSRIGSARCTHAYAVSRTGLSKLIKRTHDYNLAVDDFLNQQFCSTNMCYYSKDYGEEHRSDKIWADGLVLQDRYFVSDID